MASPCKRGPQCKPQPLPKGNEKPDERLSLKSQWHHKGLAWLLQIGEQSVSEKTEARGKHWRERRIIVIGKKKEKRVSSE